MQKAEIVGGGRKAGWGLGNLTPSFYRFLKLLITGVHLIESPSLQSARNEERIMVDLGVIATDMLADSILSSAYK